MGKGPSGFGEQTHMAWHLRAKLRLESDIVEQRMRVACAQAGRDPVSSRLSVHTGARLICDDLDAVETDLDSRG